MNLLLFDRHECTEAGQLYLTGTRLAHLREVFDAAEGHELAVGEIGGRIGRGILRKLAPDHALIDITLDREPPPRLPLTLVLALPRPKMLRRVLHASAEFGVSDLHLINSSRVEKSFWQSDLLAPAALRNYLLAGAAQVRDTRLPEIHLQRGFRPFVEDLLPELCQSRLAMIAHPGEHSLCPAVLDQPALILIGPEAGFSDFEVELACRAGCRPVSLGSRTLRVETAVVAALGRLLPRG